MSPPLLLFRKRYPQLTLENVNHGDVVSTLRQSLRSSDLEEGAYYYPQKHRDKGLCDCRRFCKGRPREITGRVFIKHFQQEAQAAASTTHLPITTNVGASTSTPDRTSSLITGSFAAPIHAQLGSMPFSPSGAMDTRTGSAEEVQGMQVSVPIMLAATVEDVDDEEVVSEGRDDIDICRDELWGIEESPIDRIEEDSGNEPFEYGCSEGPSDNESVNLEETSSDSDNDESSTTTHRHNNGDDRRIMSPSQSPSQDTNGTSPNTAGGPSVAINDINVGQPSLNTHYRAPTQQQIVDAIMSTSRAPGETEDLFESRPWPDTIRVASKETYTGGREPLSTTLPPIERMVYTIVTTLSSDHNVTKRGASFALQAMWNLVEMISKGPQLDINFKTVARSLKTAEKRLCVRNDMIQHPVCPNKHCNNVFYSTKTERCRSSNTRCAHIVERYFGVTASHS